MPLTNKEIVGRGLDVLKAALAPYVLRELQKQYGARWWENGIEPIISKSGKIFFRGVLPTEENKFTQLDTPTLLKIIDRNWDDVFGDHLDRVSRSYVNELISARNDWAHESDINIEQAARALQTMRFLLKAIHAPGEAALLVLDEELKPQSRVQDSKSNLNFENGSKTQVEPIAQEIETSLRPGSIFQNLVNAGSDRLKRVACRGKTITYMEFARALYLNIDSAADRTLMWNILEQVSRDEYKAGRPLLAVVVVSQSTQIAGSGFFKLARELGVYSGFHDRIFFARELKKVHEHWKNPNYVT